MVVLGILLLVVALAVLAFVLLGGLPPGPDTQVSFEVLGLALDTTAVAVFGLGALTLLLLQLAVLCIRSGARKSARRRAELQRLRRVEAEVRSRQAAEAQRNASAAEPTYAPAAAPFARRDSGDRPVRDGSRPGDGDRPAPAVADGDSDGDGDRHLPEGDADRSDRGAGDLTEGDGRPSGSAVDSTPRTGGADARTATLATPGPTPPTGGSGGEVSEGDAPDDRRT